MGLSTMLTPSVKTNRRVPGMRSANFRIIWGILTLTVLDPAEAPATRPGEAPGAQPLQVFPVRPFRAFPVFVGFAAVAGLSMRTL